MSHAGAQDFDDPGVSLPQYAYAPLQHVDEIRLLRIAPGTWNDPIHCDIFHCQLSQNVSYEALSYTWGSEEKPFTIDCGEDRWLAVTSNCFDAIKRLRNSCRPRTIWIDAVCINQANDLERGHQVRNMTLLYKEADRVIVYLGEAGDESTEVLRYLQYNSKFSTSDGWLHVLKKLLRRPWFTRIWVLQEVYMARSLTVVCGNVSILWEHCIGRLREFPSEAFLDEGLPLVVNLRAHDSSASQRRWDLFELLIGTGDYACTDPRDRIFALLSMSSDDSHQGIEADYESSPRDIYIRVAAHLLNSRYVNDVLAAVDNGPDSSELDLPSWVPDWRIRRRCTPITRLVDHAPHNLPRAFRILKGYTLDVQGCCVGIIGDLGDVLEPYKSWLSDDACMTNWWQLFARAYPGAESDDLKEILQMPFHRSHLFDFFLVEIRDLIASLVQSVSHACFQSEVDLARCANLESKGSYKISHKQVMTEIMGALQKRIRQWKLHETYRKPIRPPVPYDLATEIVWEQVHACNRDKDSNRQALPASTALGDQKHVAMTTSALAKFDDLMATLHSLGIVEKCAQHIDVNLLAWRFDNILHGCWKNENGYFTLLPDTDRQKIFRCCRGRRLFALRTLVGLVPAGARQGDRICLLTACKYPVLLRREDNDFYKVVGACYINGVIHEKPEDFGKQRFLIQ